MDNITLKANKHEYITEDGKKLPSVSDIISCLSCFCYGDVDPFILQQAAERGTAVHRAIIDLQYDGIVEVDSAIAPYVEAFAKWMNEHVYYKILSEEPMRYMDEYAGTIDWYGKVDDVFTLIDFKTNSKLSGKQLTLYSTQLNLYRRMLENHEYPVAQMYILHLTKDGEYKLYEAEKDDTLADMCLFIWKKMHERKRRKK